MVPSRLPALVVLVASLLLVPSTRAQLAAGQHPNVYIEALGKEETLPGALAAQAHLMDTDAATALPLALAAVDRARGDVGRAALLGATLGMGDRTRLADALGVLDGPSNEQAQALMAPLVRTGLIPEVEARLPLLKVRLTGPAAPFVDALETHYYNIHHSGFWGSGLGLFLVILLLAVLGGAGYVVSLAGKFDSLKGKIQDWTDKPPGRDKMLKDLRETMPDVATKLIPYLEDRSLSAAEMAGLIEMLAHFDLPEVHEALAPKVESKNKLIKGAAILAMAKFKGDIWPQELVRLLQEGDEIAKFAAAKALAERGDKSKIPLLQQLHDATPLGSVKDALRDAIDRLTILPG